MLKRYWFIVSPEEKYGTQNFGVSAFSSEQAKTILKAALTSIEWRHVSEEMIEKAEIV